MCGFNWRSTPSAHQFRRNTHTRSNISSGGDAPRRHAGGCTYAASLPDRADGGDTSHKRHSKCEFARTTNSSPITLTPTAAIDPERDTCERCGSRLEPLFATKAGTAFQGETSNFPAHDTILIPLAYLKANMSSAKAALRGATHGEVMRALSRQWTEAGPSADHQAHWESLASTA
jgi:hypothetical protein